MLTNIDICNMALSHLGVSGIVNLTQDIPAVVECNKFYDPAIRATMSANKWPFCTIRKSLTSIEDETLQLDWQYAYVYPVAALRVWNVFNETTVADKDTQEFEVFYQQDNNRKVILTDNDLAYAEYTIPLADANLYPYDFAMAFSLLLAANMSHSLIGDAKLGTELLAQYATMISEAQRISYAERKKKPKQTSSYQSVRG